MELLRASAGVLRSLFRAGIEPDLLASVLGVLRRVVEGVTAGTSEESLSKERTSEKSTSEGRKSQAGKGQVSSAIQASTSECGAERTILQQLVRLPGHALAVSLLDDEGAEALQWLSGHLLRE